jgi:hypothetical protein
MKKILLILALPVLLIFAYTPGHALGIGAYGTFSYTDACWEDLTNSSINGDLLHYFAGGGLVIDTAVAKKNIFNYRMNLGLGQIWEKAKESDPFDEDLSGIEGEFINSFGFGIVRIPLFRLWLGPQLGIRFAHFDYPGNLDVDRLTFLPGAVLGFNINIGDLFTISLDGGFRYNLGVTFYTSDDVLNDRVYSSLGPEGFVNLSVIFRIDDTMASEKKSSSSEKNKENTTEEKKSETKDSKGKVSNEEDY